MYLDSKRQERGFPTKWHQQSDDQLSDIIGKIAKKSTEKANQFQ